MHHCVCNLDQGFGVRVIFALNRTGNGGVTSRVCLYSGETHSSFLGSISRRFFSHRATAARSNTDSLNGAGPNAAGMQQYFSVHRIHTGPAPHGATGMAASLAAGRAAALAGKGAPVRTKVRSRVMRILRNLVQIAGLQLMLLVPAHAFDGTPASNEQITPERMTASEALRLGARKYYSGDKQAALDSLRYAAENGQPMAAWKLGQMYAAGDGVAEDDYKAFEYYNQVVSLYGDESPTSPQAPFVSSAFVALGKYYMTGIKNTQVKANPARARQIFTHAASYFGDAEAQYELGQIYRENNDLMAVRWFNLAALKGHIGAQALLGETLFNLADSLENRERGLMWMTIARAHAAEEGVGDLGWVVDMQERYFSLASEDIRRSAARRADAWMAKHEPMRAPSAEALSAATLR